MNIQCKKKRKNEKKGEKKTILVVFISIFSVGKGEKRKNTILVVLYPYSV